MRKYGYIKLCEDSDKLLLCTWNENFINRIIDDVTNTMYTKPVKDMITGEVIVPDPFVFVDMDTLSIKKTKKLTYVDYPIEISEEKAKKFLTDLNNNNNKLIEYVSYIKGMKKEKEEKRKSHSL